MNADRVLGLEKVFDNFGNLSKKSWKILKILYQFFWLYQACPLNSSLLSFY